jgi:hypothetical protein
MPRSEAASRPPLSPRTSLSPPGAVQLKRVQTKKGLSEEPKALLSFFTLDIVVTGV